MPMLLPPSAGPPLHRRACGPDIPVDSPMQALSGIANNQTLEYDFQYYQLPINTDIPVLALSHKRSLLRCDRHRAPPPPPPPPPHPLSLPPEGRPSHRNNRSRILPVERFLIGEIVCLRVIARESVSLQVPLHATTAVGDPDALAASLAVSNVPGVRRYLARARQMKFELPDEVTCHAMPCHATPRRALLPPRPLLATRLQTAVLRLTLTSYSLSARSGFGPHKVISSVPWACQEKGCLGCCGPRLSVPPLRSHLTTPPPPPPLPLPRGQQMSATIEKAIVSYKKGSANVDPQVFHRWMTVSLPPPPVQSSPPPSPPGASCFSFGGGRRCCSSALQKSAGMMPAHGFQL